MYVYMHVCMKMCIYISATSSLWYDYMLQYISLCNLFMSEVKKGGALLHLTASCPIGKVLTHLRQCGYLDDAMKISFNLQQTWLLLFLCLTLIRLTWEKDYSGLVQISQHLISTLRSIFTVTHKGFPPETEGEIKQTGGFILRKINIFNWPLPTVFKNN